MYPLCWCSIALLAYAGPAACQYGRRILRELPVIACMAGIHLLKIQYAGTLARLSILLLASRPFLFFAFSQWVTWNQWQWRPESWDPQYWSNSVSSAFNMSCLGWMLSPAWLHNYQGTEVLYGTWPLLRGIPQVPDDFVSGTYKSYVDARGYGLESV